MFGMLFPGNELGIFIKIKFLRQIFIHYKNIFPFEVL